MNPAQREPVAISGALTAVVVAAIPLLRAFNVTISQEQANTTLAFVAALIVLATLLVRQYVTPVGKAQSKIDEAYLTQPGEPKPTL